MAAITQTTICNSALIKLGAEVISSLDDSNKRAKLCKEQYEKVKKNLLLSHPWNFAITRKELAEIVYTPAFEYDHAFLIPSDCLRILDTSMNVGARIGETKWVVESREDTGERILLTNETDVSIRYLKNVGEAVFSNSFAELLAMKMAKELCYALTQSAQLLATLKKEYEDMLRTVRSYDAAEGSVRVVEADDFLLARLTGGPGFYGTD